MSRLVAKMSEPSRRIRISAKPALVAVYVMTYSLAGFIDGVTIPSTNCVPGLSLMIWAVRGNKPTRGLYTTGLPNVSTAANVNEAGKFTTALLSPGPLNWDFWLSMANDTTAKVTLDTLMGTPFTAKLKTENDPTCVEDSLISYRPGSAVTLRLISLLCALPRMVSAGVVDMAIPSRDDSCTKKYRAVSTFPDRVVPVEILTVLAPPGAPGVEE
mmetsp:Transcript_27896/g.46734  ORF Transcript_27896/g.46734 Transcript_27896/m.46734 type:complete len:214 (+) Transcript_27896:4937-5578(+)